jgi:hypothetical protein
MPRKERKQKKLAQEEPTKRATPTIIAKDAEGNSIHIDTETKIETALPDADTPGEMTPPTGTDEGFRSLCMNIQKALNSEAGKKLNCRLRILVSDKEAIVYQGLLGNVWGRFRVTGDHNIYRHALKGLLMNSTYTIGMNFQ